MKKLAADAMFKLEHGVEDKKKLQKAAPTLSELVDVQSGWHDDYMQNRMLRAKFRVIILEFLMKLSPGNLESSMVWLSMK